MVSRLPLELPYFSRQKSLPVKDTMDTRRQESSRRQSREHRTSDSEVATTHHRVRVQRSHYLSLGRSLCTLVTGEFTE
eukprot:scaffold2796_cov65-Phaeocystis_antarctica.AAC.2